jgi:AcrR family transcriptional regulator
MRLSSRRLEQRERLLAAAYEMVAEVGIEGLRTREISKKAGLNLAIFHYCFGSKDDLLRALYQHIISRFRTETDHFITIGQPPKQRLESLMRLRVYLTQHMGRDLKVWRSFQGLAETNEAVRELLRDHFAGQRERITEVLRDGVEKGDFILPQGTDPSIAAAMIVSLQHGMVSQLGVDLDAFDAELYASSVLEWISASPKVAQSNL